MKNSGKKTSSLGGLATHYKRKNENPVKQLKCGTHKAGREAH
jgi:hypothetical protein